MSWSLLFFIAVGAVSLAAAAGVVVSRVPVHSALFLLVNFASLAVLYIMLDAQFLAAAQVIIYAGGIVILILFVIMLIGSDRIATPAQRSWIPYVGVVLGLILLASITASLLAGGVGAVPTATAIQAGIPEAVGISLYTQYILPFELVAILLLVALIGALLLARRIEPHP